MICFPGGGSSLGKGGNHLHPKAKEASGMASLFFHGRSVGLRVENEIFCRREILLRVVSRRQNVRRVIYRIGWRTFSRS